MGTHKAINQGDRTEQRDHRHHGSPFGPGWPGDWFFGSVRGGPFHRPRARRGDVPALILSVLADQPNTGYGIIHALEERSAGAWRPSPGSVYPILEQLVSDGLVRQDKQNDGKLYALTPAGEAYVTSHHDNIAARCGAFTSSQGAGLSELRRAAAQLMVAVFQIAQAGTAAQRTLAGKLLAQTRRGLYRILADVGDDADGEEQP